MSSIKQDRVDFEKLLNGIDPVGPVGGNQSAGVPVSTGAQQTAPQTQSPGQQQNAALVDNTSAAEMMEAKLFEFDYDAAKKKIMKRCRRTVMNIINHILPEDMISDPYVMDKVEQDINTLTGLYMQIECNEVMQKSMMDQVSKGMASARTYEVYWQGTDRVTAINKQIIETEQRLRKTYVDLKYEIQDMRQEKNVPVAPMIAGPVQNQGGGVLITSTKSLIEEARKAKTQAYLNAKETKVEIVKK